MAYLVAGPFIALVGIVAVFFVFRHKSVEKRSMYSARRSQIEHKVRAARQRTLAPRGHGKPASQTTPGGAAPAPFAPQQAQPTMTWEAPAFEAPPVAPPSAPAWSQPQQAQAPAPWDMPVSPAAQAPAPAAAPVDYPLAPAPAPTLDYPPVEPAPSVPAWNPSPAEAAPGEPAWTPAAAPSPPAAPLEPAATAAASASAAGSWSVVTSEKESAQTVADGNVPSDGKKRKKDKRAAAAAAGSWELASGDAPGMEADEPELKRPSGTLVAIAQYAVLVVGLVMVLIGVLVMVANSKVT
jgi:hypothetical protein